MTKIIKTVKRYCEHCGAENVLISQSIEDGKIIIYINQIQRCFYCKKENNFILDEKTYEEMDKLIAEFVDA
jgi:PP-loop superfamily ATP-utilizing enzyme